MSVTTHYLPFVLSPHHHLFTQALMANSVIFSKLVEEYGTTDSDNVSQEGGEPPVPGSPKALRKRSERRQTEAESSSDVDLKKVGEKNGALMQEEERETGAVSWKIYKAYMRYAGGLYWGPWILLLLVLTQGAAGAL